MRKRNNLAIEPEFIPDFPIDSDYNGYRKLVLEDYLIVKEYFPLLKLTSLPCLNPKEIYITGNLIPIEVYNDCKSSYDIDRNSFKILSIYPYDFPNDNIYVEDFYGKIDWAKIPCEHRHQNLHPKTKREILCTHHPYGEINGFRQNERTIAILFSAWKIYRQYKTYQITKEWTLPDLEHGDNAKEQLKEMGKYYGRY